jgi:hypothetical protein
MVAYSLLQPLSTPKRVQACQIVAPSCRSRSLQSNALVIIPAHQIGLRRYSVLSTGPLRSAPRTLARLAASLRPFFVMMKLVPMATEDAIASPRPIHLESQSQLYAFAFPNTRSFAHLSCL